MNTAHYPRYEHYKDSGTDWLGEIPSDWEIVPAFKCIKENKVKNIGLIENTVLSLSYGKIIVKPEEKMTGLVPESFETYQIVEPNDIIIRCTDLQNDKVSLRTGLVNNKGIITSAYLGLKVLNNYNARFLHYYLHNLDITKAIYKFGTGLRQNLSFLDFKRLPLLNISNELQTAIADFLDQKTAQIDQAIALKQAQIDKLNEYKQIIIQKAVTHGLNPNAPMKNSGVDWIGDIPEHWEVKKLKFVVNKIGDIDHYMPETIDDGVPYAMTGDLQELSSKINFTACKKISYKDYLTLSRKIKPQKGDVIFARYATIGTVCYVDRHTDFLISYSCLTIKPNLKDILGLFLFYYLKSNSFFCGIQSKINSNTQGNVGVESLKNIHVSLPPINEQQEIVAHIERMNEQIHQTMTNYQTQIDRLKEYRHILINQAVTGKIKVC